MSEAVLTKFMLNDDILNVSSFDTIYKNVSPSIYEVIRIFNGVPLFLEDHYNRLKNSISIMGFTVDISFENLKTMIYKMINENSVTDYNIKLIMNSFNKNNYNIYLYFIQSNYPKESLYSVGIDTMTYKAVRENPNAKVIYQQMRDDINSKLIQNNMYEALLVNDHNNVTEGSRSNLFFIKNQCVYTAPESEVLIGVTRLKIVELIRKNNIEICEQSISAEDISNFDAGFISGTSPKVLPIRKIDSNIYDTDNSLLRKIIELYNDEILSYVKSAASK